MLLDELELAADLLSSLSEGSSTASREAGGGGSDKGSDGAGSLFWDAEPHSSSEEDDWEEEEVKPQRQHWAAKPPASPVARGRATLKVMHLYRPQAFRSVVRRASLELGGTAHGVGLRDLVLIKNFQAAKAGDGWASDFIDSSEEDDDEVEVEVDEVDLPQQQRAAAHQAAGICPPAPPWRPRQSAKAPAVQKGPREALDIEELSELAYKAAGSSSSRRRSSSGEPFALPRSEHQKLGMPALRFSVLDEREQGGGASSPSKRKALPSHPSNALPSSPPKSPRRPLTSIQQNVRPEPGHAATVSLARQAAFAPIVFRDQVADLQAALIQSGAYQAYKQKSTLLAQAIFDFKVRCTLAMLLLPSSAAAAVRVMLLLPSPAAAAVRVGRGARAQMMTTRCPAF
jgi:hypothetical protein